MNEANRARKPCAAQAPGCRLWTPIVTAPAAVADNQHASIFEMAGSDVPFLADPEGIEARLAAAV